MELNEFRKRGHELIDWMADYFQNIEDLPVKSQVIPRDVISRLPDDPPLEAESFGNVFDDFKQIILPGMTHWQHPGWHGYFMANNSYPSVLGEMLTSTLGAQCMSWITSPAAAELEERVMEWAARMIGLPACFTGVIQDTASTATLVSLLTAREKATKFRVNSLGLYNCKPFTIYCSTEAHSSIEKAVKIAGFGKDNLRKIEVDEHYAMQPGKLEEVIKQDIENGCIPLAVVAAIGTTGSTAVDPLEEIGIICEKYNLWLHVDAAWAGTALLLPEMRWMIRGIEYVDTFVFNPHKWMFTNFDCTAYFVKDKEALILTFEILPEYLKTKNDSQVNNYRDWGIQLGRRFRALKLWFVIRTFGVHGLQEKIRNHIAWANAFADRIRQDPDFELLAPSPLATVCFRYRPQRITDEDQLDRMNSGLLETINQTGKVFLSHTRLNGKFTIRFVVGQTNTEKHHIDDAWALISEMAKSAQQK